MKPDTEEQETKNPAVQAAQRKFILGVGQSKVRMELLDKMNEKPEEVPAVRARTRKFLRSNKFEFTMGCIIMFNMIAMIVETDRSTLDDEDTKGTHWTEIFGWIVLVLFIIELLIRLYAYSCDFWLDRWNRFDFLIVTIDTVFSLVGLVAGDLFPVSVLRVFRLAKLARISKVMRVFPELRLLIAGIVCSTSAIFWGLVLMLFCILVFALVAVLFIHPLNKDVDYGDCSRCPRAYSSVMQASLTFWQQIITGDSWGSATIPLIEEHPITAIFFLAVYLTLGMAVMNLILGVVVSVAQQAKENLEAEDHKEDMLLEAEQHTHLLELCVKMDEDNDGVISHAEICKAYEEPGEFRDALTSLDITRDEIDIVWKVIDHEKHGFVPYEDVVGALYAVKTSDTQFMLAYIKHYITVMKESFVTAMREQSDREKKLERNVQNVRRDLKEVEALEFGVWQTLHDQESLQGACHEGIETNPASTETSRVLKAEVMDSESCAWLKQVCHRIATARVELDDILTAMKGRVELKSVDIDKLASPASAKTAGFTCTNMQARGNSLAAGDKSKPDISQSDILHAQSGFVDFQL